jgi:hypothetical protein
VALLPSPDRWVPLPGSGSRPTVLSRRSPLVPPTASVPPGGHWTLARSDDSAVPVLERHWACGTLFLARTPPIRTDSYGEETVTAPANTTPPLLNYLTFPDSTPTAVPPTVTLNPLDSSPQTVTRFCVGCGKPLEGKRPQAKAHGVACRQRAYRRRKKEAAQAQAQRQNGRRSEPELPSLTRTAVG